MPLSNLRPDDDRRPAVSCARLWSSVGQHPKSTASGVAAAWAALALLTVCQMHGGQRAANAGNASLAARRVRAGLKTDTAARVAAGRLIGGVCRE